MYAKTRPSTRPSIFAPRHAPLHHRPSHSLKNVGIFQNSVESLKFTSHQKLPAPPRAPPCFMVVKFKIRAQTFHIIIFHENAFLLMYRPNRLFGIRSFTMISVFTGKKINIVTVLDHFLQFFEFQVFLGATFWIGKFGKIHYFFKNSNEKCHTYVKRYVFISGMYIGLTMFLKRKRSSSSMGDR